jgi:glucosamine--fructose-6-phosphate aminotransferase (isomerizing)
LLDGLGRLEYRGYDSAGVATLLADGKLEIRRTKGKLENLRKLLAEAPFLGGNIGIGHTRWATHGRPSEQNAHPHRAGKVVVIHNGIIENYAGLKAELVADGVEFESETDTEVAAHLVARAYVEHGDLPEAMRTVCRRLDGAFTLLAVHADEPGVVVGARRNSPLVVGVGEGENFLGSDVAAFISSAGSSWAMSTATTPCASEST